MDVLLVEDEPLVGCMLATELEHAARLSVAHAITAEEALGALMRPGRCGAALPPVLVTDIALGSGMDGLALADEVRRRWPEVGVVFITGRQPIMRGRSFGPRERLLLKPFALGALTHAVRDLMVHVRRSSPQRPTTPPRLPRSKCEQRPG
jgi:DNA-binding response OmpR family regulator